MLRLKFMALETAYDEAVESPGGFRLAENFMHALPDDSVVASFANHHWWVAEKPFARFDCHGPLMIRFQSYDGTPTQNLGPYSAASVSDGAVYADKELVAKLVEETALWHSLKLETYWSNLVLVPPA